MTDQSDTSPESTPPPDRSGPPGLRPRLPSDSEPAPPAGRSGSPAPSPLLRKVDAVTVRVPDLESGLAFYRDRLGHELLWRNDEIGQAGLSLPETDTEIVLATELDYAPSWLVEDADEAARVFVEAGGRIIAEPFDIPVGRCVVLADAFGNELVLLDLSKGLYETDDNGSVTGVEKRSAENPVE